MRLRNRSPFKPRGNVSKYKIQNKAASDETSIYLYDEIGWFGIEAEQFIKDLNAITAKTINIHVNSPGGDVFDGTAIFNAIKQHKSKTITHIDGLAASISSIIALASNEVHMAENAFLMIHEPWSIVIGNAETMRDEADLLDKIGGTIAKTYINKTGKDEAEIKELMADESWLSADEALDMGFIDIIDKDNQDEKAQANLFDLSVFANVPDQLRHNDADASKKNLNERDLEKNLRDAGYSRNQAKEIVAKVFRDERDVQNEVVNHDERDVQIDGNNSLRDAGEPKRKDRTADLLTRAEMVAPVMN